MGSVWPAQCRECVFSCAPTERAPLIQPPLQSDGAQHRSAPEDTHIHTMQEGERRGEGEGERERERKREMGKAEEGWRRKVLVKERGRLSEKER